MCFFLEAIDTLSLPPPFSVELWEDKELVSDEEPLCLRFFKSSVLWLPKSIYSDAEDVYRCKLEDEAPIFSEPSSSDSSGVLSFWFPPPRGFGNLLA